MSGSSEKTADVTHLPDTVKQNGLSLSHEPREPSADAGHFSEKKVTFLDKREISA